MLSDFALLRIGDHLKGLRVHHTQTKQNKTKKDELKQTKTNKNKEKTLKLIVSTHRY
jgi:hypothetical protein